MALKAKLTKAEHTALPEALREHYTEKDGVFVLEADGVVHQEEYDALELKLGEFRDNNRKLHGDLKKFEGVDPDEYKTLKSKVGQKPDAGDLATQIAQAVEKATNPLMDRLKGIETERDEARKQLTDRALEEALWEAGEKAGIKKTARRDYISRAKEVFTFDDGKIVAKKGDAIVFSKRRGHTTDPLTPEEWAADPEWLLKEADHLFEKSSGAGAPNKGGGGGNGGNGRVIANDPEAVSRSLEDIASGKVTIQS